MQWFGHRPFSSLCDADSQVDVPVGQQCSWCDELIEATQCGAVLPQLSADAEASPTSVFHHECLFRMMVGSSGHQRQQCPCYGMEDGSEAGLTARQAALAAWKYFQSTMPKETVH